MPFNFGGALLGGLTGFFTGGPGGAVAGALGGGLAQGRRPPKSIGNKYYDEAFIKGMRIFDQTDFAKLDEQALAEYSKVAKDEGTDLLESYDARAAGAGSGVAKLDTSKDMARTAIAGDVSKDIGRKRAELILTRSARKRALLPGLDQPSSLGLEQRPGNLESLSTLGQFDFGTLFKKRPRRGGGDRQPASSAPG